MGGTVLEEFADLDILGVTFDAKITFDKHLCFVSRAGFKGTVSRGSSGEDFMISCSC